MKLSLISPEGRRKYLNWAERSAFFEAVQSCPDPRKKAFCLTLFYTGCRISEALELTDERIDFSEQTIAFRTLKRRDPKIFRFIPIPPSLVQLLDDIVKKSRGKIWPFSRPTGYRLVRRYMENAGIKGIQSSPKGLRHSYAVACDSKEVSVPRIQRWLGHSSLEMTARYLETVGKDDRQHVSKIWLKSERKDLKIDSHIW